MPPGAEAQFGKYKLLAKIAAGGMAIAYRAELSGAAGVRKRVVLKVIHPHLAQEKNFVQMFISEAKVAASLTHGNIAQVFDFGQIDGRYYLSMEEVIGQPLMKVLKVSREKGFARFPVPLALQIGIGVLDGLHYAHTRKDESGVALNLVHRDVTPDNVLLSYEGEVKVVDFGIAKTTFSVDQTEAGMVRGKYPYLSPEQASGQRDLDARTDIWAAGIQIYDMLCGRRPYEGEFLHVMKDIVNTGPVPSMRHLAPQLDVELENIVMGALKKPRAERYATAREFSLALTNYLHQNYPSSTREDVHFLLASLFAAEASKEGADVNVPPSFNQQMAHASGSGTSKHEKYEKPGPPVATDEADAGPRITARPSESVRNLVGLADEPSSDIDIDLELSGKGAQVTDEEPTVATTMPPPRPKNTNERAGLPPKKKAESSRRIKPIDSSPPRPRIATPEPRSVTEPEARLPEPEADDFPTQSALPETRPKKAITRPPAKVDPEAEKSHETDRQPPVRPAADTREVSQEVSQVDEGTNATRRRGPVIAAVAVLGLGGLGLAGLIAYKTLAGPAQPPGPAMAQLWVTSSPPGATFKVDGAGGGKTPGSASVTAGEHAVLVELPGYAPWSRQVAARGNENVNVSATLELVGSAPAADVDGGPAVEVDAGAAVAAVPDGKTPPAEEAPKAAGQLTDESHYAKWPKRFSTLRLAKMALPLSQYAPLRIELKGAKSVYTQGQVTLGPGRTANALFYVGEPAGEGPPQFGILSSSPRSVKGLKAIRVFAFDDDLSDNSGAMRVTMRVDQYTVERSEKFEASKHAIALKPEHYFRIEGMNENAQYLFFSRPDMPQLNKTKEGLAKEVLCISQTSKPRALNKTAHLIPIGAKVILDDTAGLLCTFPDEVLDDNSGSVELDIVDAAKAADEGVNAKQYQKLKD